MKPLTPANDLQSSFLYILLILLCCYFIYAFFYSVQGRMYSNMVIACTVLILTTVSENRMKRMMRGSCNLHLSAWMWYLYLFVLFAIAIWIGMRIRDYRKRRITPMIIKECGDRLPAGICFWKKGGRVIFVNKKMQQLCYAITGSQMMNGEEFYHTLTHSNDMAEQNLRLNDGSVWHIQHHEIGYRNDTYSELIATDVTDLYRETQELESKTEELRKMNDGLRQYKDSIEEIVKEKEILKARINIHDQMNRLMLTTEQTVHSGDSVSRKEMLAGWKECALFLRKETAQESENNLLRDLSTFGNLMGIQFVCGGIPTIRNREIRRLLARSAREAMTNAVKHGHASHLYAAIRKEENLVYCEFRDNCKPISDVNEKAGGLRTMEEEVKRLGGKLSIDQTDGFKVTIMVPDRL